MKSKLLALLVLLLLVSLAICWLLLPPITISKENNSIEVNLRQLGEYTSDLAQIELKKCVGDELVWSLKASENNEKTSIQIFQIQLAEGENSIDLVSEQNKDLQIKASDYKVSFPLDRKYFTLEKNVCYKIAITSAARPLFLGHNYAKFNF